MGNIILIENIQSKIFMIRGKKKYMHDLLSFMSKIII
jgi:hypothetical protein